MRKTQVALAALALVASTAALADGVTVYGVLDMGLGSTNNGSTTTRSFGTAGSQSPSLFGVRGSEDLGNGMKASFNLEAGLTGGNGSLGNGSASYATGTTSTSAVNTSLFGRAANVGLEGDFGSVKLGTHMDPGFAAAAGVDPRGMANDSGSAVNFWGFSQSTGPAVFQGIFNANSVMYSSPSVNGLQVSASYGFGGVTSSRQDGTQSIGLTYAAGIFSLAGWRNTVYADGANAKLYTNQGIGAKIALSDVLSANVYYNKVETYSTSNVVTAERDLIGVGATYALQDNLKASATFYTRNNSLVANSDNTLTVFDLKYVMSPRTTAYVSYAMDNAKAEAGAYAAINTNGSRATTGIIHSF
jgi:predicted porin